MTLFRMYIEYYLLINRIFLRFKGITTLREKVEVMSYTAPKVVGVA